MSTFTLHPTLAKDTVEIGRLQACRALLMRDRTYPWVILVPEQDGLRDFDDLSPSDRDAVTQDIDHVSKVLKQVFKPYKLNVAALGNVVEQLHIHVVARFQDDPAWPAPIWGVQPPADYDDADRARVLADLRTALGLQ